MAQYKKEHRRDIIKAQPLAKVQQAFVTHASKGTLDDAARAELIRSLEASISDNDTRHHYFHEKDNVEEALKKGKAPHEPSIALPETSLLWAINLAHLAQKKDKKLYDGELWKQFAGSDGAAQSEKEWLSFYIASTGVSNDTRLNWGELGSSFYFDTKEKRINLDLILALGVGFDAGRTVSFHEIGHSNLTKGFGEKIDALDTQIKAMLKKGKDTKLTQAEYKAMNRLSSERQYRYMVFDEAENNVVDRWTVNQGPRIRKDHALGRNKAEATLIDGLLAGELDTVNDTPMNRFRNVKHAIRHSFFRNNGYFPDSEAGWREVGINPDWITTKDGKSGMAALAVLKELCGGVETLQPNSNDMMMGAAKLAAATLEYSQQRNKRIEEIYDTLIAHVVEPLLDQQQQELEKQMEQAAQNQQQGKGQSTPQQGDGQDSGEPQEGEGQGKPGSGQSKGQGKSQPGEGGGGESQKGDGQGKPGSGQGKGQGKSQPSEGGGGGEPQDSEGEGKPGSGQGKGQGKSQPGEGGGGGGEAQDGDEQGKGKPGSSQSSSKPGSGETVKVEGLGDMPGVDAPPETPQEAHNANKPGAGKETEGKHPDKGQTIEELEQARQERQEREANEHREGQGESTGSCRAGGQNQGFKSARGIGKSNVESKPLVGNWGDYQAMAIEFSAEIRQRQQRLDQLRERQLQTQDKASPERTLLPVDGDMRRLDRSAHAALIKKILHERVPTEDDARRFENDRQKPIPSNMDVVLLVDGSGSMHSSGGKWPFPPIQAGMHAGCVLNEACKSDAVTKRQANFYMGLWGNDMPLMLVKPGDNAHEVGKRIAGVKHSQGWGTSLAPSIKHATAQLMEGQKSQATSPKTGYSHIIVLSDGGIADAHASFQTISKLLENCPLVSIDFVVIDNSKTEMDGLAKKLETAFPGRVGTHHHTTTATVSEGMETLLLERIRNTPVTQAVSRDHKRGALARAYSAMML